MESTNKTNTISNNNLVNLCQREQQNGTFMYPKHCHNEMFWMGLEKAMDIQLHELGHKLFLP